MWGIENDGICSLVALTRHISCTWMPRPEYAPKMSKNNTTALGAIGVHTGINSLKEVV